MAYPTPGKLVIDARRQNAYRDDSGECGSGKKDAMFKFGKAQTRQPAPHSEPPVAEERLQATEAALRDVLE